MANMKLVNKAIKTKYPTLDIELIRGDGYAFFIGVDGFDKLDSIYAHPPVTNTEVMVRLAFEEIESVYKGGN